jgi:uncharacterized protein YukE
MSTSTAGPRPDSGASPAGTAQVSTPPPAGDAILQLEALLEQLAAGLSRLSCPECEGALDDIDRVQDELARCHPDANRLYELMDHIAAVVIPVAALRQAAEQAARLIEVITR